MTIEGHNPSGSLGRLEKPLLIEKLVRAYPHAVIKTFPRPTSPVDYKNGLQLEPIQNKHGTCGVIFELSDKNPVQDKTSITVVMPTDRLFTIVRETNPELALKGIMVLSSKFDHQRVNDDVDVYLNISSDWICVDLRPTNLGLRPILSIPTPITLLEGDFRVI